MFHTCDLTRCINKCYGLRFCEQNIMSTYFFLCLGGNKIRTAKRNQMMYQYGGTIGPAQFPTFKTNKYQLHNEMLPRPVVKSRPCQLGHVIMNRCTWLKDLCLDIERLTLQYLLEHKELLTVPHPVLGTQSTVSLIDLVVFSKKHIPPCLRICNTLFTQMILVGSYDVSSGYIPPHYDDDDYITALVSLGNSRKVSGGDTFYAEVKKDGMLLVKKRVKYRHGNVQIGLYDRVLHGSFKWCNGERGVINFSLQKKILRHFYCHGEKFYKQYIEAGYPTGSFQAL